MACLFVTLKDRSTETLMLGTILLVLVLLLLIGTLPSWGYSRGWGYLPSGVAGLLLIAVLVLLVMGVL